MASSMITTAGRRSPRPQDMTRLMNPSEHWTDGADATGVADTATSVTCDMCDVI